MDSTFKWPICKFSIPICLCGSRPKTTEGRKNHKNVSHVVSALHAIFGGLPTRITTLDYITMILPIAHNYALSGSLRSTCVTII